MFLPPRSSESEPLVSVVVPCYNYGHYLRENVLGILAQPGVEVEVIIVDDASPDGSATVAQALAASDPRIRCILHSQNAGHIATYNDGLSECRGKYVVLLSADDLLAPGSLARSVALMEHHPDVALVYGYAPSFNTEVPEPRTHVRSWSIWDGEVWIRRICHRGTNLITNPEAMMRRSVLQKIGGYDPALPHAADLLMWMQAASYGKVGRINGPDQAYYRVHGDNMHLTDFAGVHTDFLERTRTFEKFFEHDGKRLKDEGGLHVALGAALQRQRIRASRTGHLAEFVDRVRWSLSWRIWRRYGW